MQESRQTYRNSIQILESKHPGCMNASNTVRKRLFLSNGVLTLSDIRWRVEPLPGPIRIQFLTASKSYLKICTRALILDRLACKDPQENFTNSFAIKADV